MPTIPPDARDLVVRTRLGFVATTNEDGTPNLSPKGTLTVWDDDTLMFADLDSPGTLRNLARDPAVEVNVVDVFLRKGFRFRGRARVLSSGPEFEGAVARYVAGPEEVRMESGSAIRHVVLVDVEETRPLVSPAYRGGVGEDDMRRRWMAHYAETGGPSRRRESAVSIVLGIATTLLTLLGLAYYAFDPGLSIGGEWSTAGLVALVAVALAVVAALMVGASRRRRTRPDRLSSRYTDRWSV